VLQYPQGQNSEIGHLEEISVNFQLRPIRLEVYRTAFEKEKELTDRPLKLAEVGKPKSNWELQGLLGLAAFVLGFLAGR
jgi:hypothetical protein